MDTSFESAGITSDLSKYLCVISCLDEKYIREVQNVLSNPPAFCKYENLKNVLIELSCKKTRELLSREEMGDRAPSKFLCHLRELAGTQLPEDFIKRVWMERLPSNVRAIIAELENVELDQLAKTADAIVAQGTQHQKAMEETLPTAQMMLEISRVLDNLTTRIEAVEISSRSAVIRGRPVDHSFSPRSRPRSRPRHDLCWYHYNFGPNAHDCRYPCNYLKGKDDGSL
ncbi:PREDICTED: uncharacterized protein LOC108560059 [Nicrophorus vespilloides]|uniref:Uncharacterized protein LOC108560059 n=1 Tax=Nicrophorus vespilloides TaxID=110193 RepID=A0ABM1MEI0_NICVS|nr:PREDICTED: uncharacterized protein LOC108560059 [Nicrophorus vespilloides]